MKLVKLILLPILAIITLLFCFQVDVVMAKDTPKISKAAATKAVHAKLPAGRILSSELEHEKGKLVWSFDVRDGYQLKEVWVDANTGEVINLETEDPAKEKVEARMDKAEAIVKKKTLGKVISSTVDGSGENLIYVFQVQRKDGTTQSVRVSAKTLKILK